MVDMFTFSGSGYAPIFCGFTHVAGLINLIRLTWR